MAVMSAGVAASAGEDRLPTVSIVIPTRNRRESLERTLAALREDSAVREVIVVDDNSDDDTPAWLATQSPLWPELMVLRAAGHGPDAARAAGVARATSQVVLFLDDDEVPMPGLASAHARHHRDRDHLVVCGYYPIVLSRRSSAVVRVLARWYDESIDRTVADPSRGLFALWGGNFSLRRSDLLGIPLSVPEFRGLKGHGDHEFGLRCHKAGLGCVLDKDLRAEHFYTRSLKQFRTDGRHSGNGAVLVHWLHGDLLGPVPRHVFESEQRLVSTFLRLTDKTQVHRVTVAALSALFGIGDAVHANKIADFSCRLLFRIERRRGALERMASLASRSAGTGTV